MSKLQQALKSGAETLESLTAKYYIKVKQHPKFPELSMLKYDQINSNMSNELVQECRGIIFNTTDWSIVARPFNKFFNYGEPLAAKIDWSTARVQEKLDGSLTIAFYYKGSWNAASSGTPDAGGNVNNSNMTFSSLFWETWNKMGYGTLGMHPTLTYMFELMTKHNRVVVSHPEPKLVLIGARDTISGQEFNSMVFVDQFKVVREFGIRSLDEVKASMEHFSGLEQEGYVVVDGDFNRVKIKHPMYVTAHHMIDSLSPKRVLDIVRTGETPEILAHFPEWSNEISVIREKYQALISEVETEYNRISNIPEQKAFASEALKTRFSAALFTKRAGKVQNFTDYFRSFRLEALCDILGL